MWTDKKPVYANDVQELLDRVEELREAYYQAQRDLDTAAQALRVAERNADRVRFVKGIELASDANNYGQAIIAPNGDVYMVNDLIEHFTVWEGVISRYPYSEHDRDRWIRLSGGGSMTTVAFGNVHRERVTDAQLNALSDFADMLDDAGPHYTRYAYRLREFVNTAPEGEAWDSEEVPF